MGHNQLGGVKLFFGLLGKDKREEEEGHSKATWDMFFRELELRY